MEAWRNMMYLIFLLTMEEQVINLLCPVRKCGLACYQSSVIHIPPGSASLDMDARPDCSFKQGVTNRILYQQNGEDEHYLMLVSLTILEISS